MNQLNGFFFALLPSDKRKREAGLLGATSNKPRHCDGACE